MNRVLIQIAVFVLYLLAQVLFFDHFTILRMATPFVFLLFILMMPMTLPLSVYLLIAFSSGLLVDLFSTNTLIGLHAFSCVLMAAGRERWIEVISNRTAFKGSEDMFLRMQSLTWYLAYIIPLVFIHHLAYFLLEEFGFSNFGYTLGKIFFSVLFTTFFVISGVALFYRKSHSR